MIFIPNSKMLVCVTTNQKPYQKSGSWKISKTNKMQRLTSTAPTISSIAYHLLLNAQDVEIFHDLFEALRQYKS